MVQDERGTLMGVEYEHASCPAHRLSQFRSRRQRLSINPVVSRRWQMPSSELASMFHVTQYCQCGNMEPLYKVDIGTRAIWEDRTVTLQPFGNTVWAYCSGSITVLDT